MSDTAMSDAPTAPPAAQVVDVVVVGSGAAGLTAAIVAAVSGLKVLVLEKAARVGGTTAWSGGVAWVPDNHLMPAAGVADSPERARQYIGAIVGEHLDGPRTEAFLAHAPAAFAFLEQHTSSVRWMSYPGVDYYPERPGALSHRGLMVQPYDGRALGEHLEDLQYPLRQLVVFGSMQADVTDVYHLQHMLRHGRSLRHAARLLWRYAQDRLAGRRGTRLLRGNAMAARLYRSALDLGITVWRQAPALALLTEADRVAGVVCVHEGRRVEVRARHGVVLASGGVAASDEFRRQLMPHAGQHLSMLPETNSGDGVRMAMAAGARLGARKPVNGCLTPISARPNGDGTVTKYPHLAFDRCKPGSVMVDAGGRRFTNEAACYHDVVQAMHAHGAVPAWLVSDARARRRYGMGLARPFPYPVRPHVASGYLIEAPTVAALAQAMGVDAGQLQQTIDAMNHSAREGHDPAFGRGANAYNRGLGDPEHGPNPNLGPIDQAPFYALRLYPGDVGTFVGTRVNTASQVLDASGEPIAGLYACGLDADSVFNGFYPGAGAMHGPNIAFAYVAARHIAAAAGARAP